MPDGVYWFSGALAFLGLINVIWGGLCALAQTDLKKLVAYSSVNHMGYALIGMAAVIAASEANGLNLKAAQAAQNSLDKAIEKRTLAIQKHSMDIDGEEKNKLIGMKKIILNLKQLKKMLKIY